MRKNDPSDVFRLRRPCADCPFRNDIQPFLSVDRACEIAEQTLINDNHFHCHKTVDYGRKSSGDVTNAQLCAGSMILQMKMKRPSVMMRMGMAFGIFKASQLDMTAPVYDSMDEFIQAHEEA